MHWFTYSVYMPWWSMWHDTFSTISVNRHYLFMHLLSPMVYVGLSLHKWVWFVSLFLVTCNSVQILSAAHSIISFTALSNDNTTWWQRWAPESQESIKGWLNYDWNLQCHLTSGLQTTGPVRRWFEQFQVASGLVNNDAVNKSRCFSTM